MKLINFLAFAIISLTNEALAWDEHYCTCETHLYKRDQVDSAKYIPYSVNKFEEIDNFCNDNSVLSCVDTCEKRISAYTDDYDFLRPLQDRAYNASTLGEIVCQKVGREVAHYQLIMTAHLNCTIVHEEADERTHRDDDIVSNLKSAYDFSCVWQNATREFVFRRGDLVPEPTTSRQTTVRPTSPGPTSVRPTSQRPTSPRPTSAKPTSPRPTSPGPTSHRPTSPRPTSARPTSARPTSVRPTSQRPTSARPTSARPTSLRPTSARPTSARPTSQRPTSVRPTSLRPTSVRPTSPIPTSPRPSVRPTSARPTSLRPTSRKPNF